MILGTFREMPGLCLHLNQAARLFGLRRNTCEVVLEDLVAQGKLRRASDGQFVGGQLDRRVPAPVTQAPRVQGAFNRGH
jgi:DNA-binding IclR family transcriptional regulator